MTSINDVIKIAENKFIPSISKYGFGKLGKKPIFIKRCNEIYHVISLDDSSYGGAFYVHVYAWVPEVYEKIVNKKNIESALNILATGGRLSRISIHSSWGWEYKDKNNKELDKLFKDILISVQSVAIPWFASVQTRKDFVEVLNDDYSNDKKLQKRILNPKQDIDLGIDKSKIDYEYSTSQLERICNKSWLDKGDDDKFLANGGRKLVNALKVAGFNFQRAPGFKFYREEENIFWIIEPKFENNGIHLSFFIYLWTPHVNEVLFGEKLKYKKTLPERIWIVTKGKYIGSKGLDKGSLVWLVAGKNYINSTTDDLVSIIEQTVIPWFKTNSTKEKFIKMLDKNQFPDHYYESLVASMRL